MSKEITIPKTPLALPNQAAGGARMTAEDRKLQILRVAVSLFSQRGFGGTTTKEIAQAAGVSEAMVFRHFATKQELYSANLTSPQASNAFQKMAVLKAKRKVEEAEGKLLAVKKWRQTFENRSTPLLRQLGPLFELIGQKLPLGVHSLGESIKALQDYAEKNAPTQATPPAAAETGGES